MPGNLSPGQTQRQTQLAASQHRHQMSGTVKNQLNSSGSLEPLPAGKAALPGIVL
jgi:hypothetical protein